MFAIAMVIAAGAPRFDTPPDVANAVVADKFAYVLGEPFSIISGKSVQMEWRGDGKKLLIVRERSDLRTHAPIGADVVVWDSNSKQTRTLWTSKKAGQLVDNLVWMGNSNRIVGQIADGESTGAIIAFDVDSGTSKNIGDFGANVMLFGSANVPYVLIDKFSRERGNPNELSLMDVSFNVRKFTSLPPRTGFPEWSSDGKKILFTSFAREPKGGELPIGTYSIDLLGGNPQKVGDLDFDSSQEIALKVVDAATSVRSTDPRTEMLLDSQVKTTGPRPTPVPKFTRSWALSGLVLIPTDGTESAALITADGRDPVLATSLTGVAYNSQGSVMARSITRIDLASYLTLKAAADRQAAMMNSKMASLALVMFSADMDGSFPQQSGWADTVMPYSRDRNVLANFNYTFAGGTIPEGKESETMLGFSQGPGGRAIAYADGHVVWEADK
jgi:prepilin-type processing-associated H-X9-DG protein